MPAHSPLTGTGSVRRLAGACRCHPFDAAPSWRRSGAALRLALALSMAVLTLTALPRAWAQAPATAAKAQPAASGFTATRSGPSWKELTATQRTALAPLSASWDQLADGHKRKWIALAANYAKLPPAEQAKLHSRMSEWAALSPQQRAQARLNFGEAQQVSPDEKRAKWEAYQALPPEDRRKLREDATARRPATAAAAAIRPVPPQKLASVPKSGADEPKPARIIVGPAPEAAASSN